MDKQQVNMDSQDWPTLKLFDPLPIMYSTLYGGIKMIFPQIFIGGIPKTAKLWIPQL